MKRLLTYLASVFRRNGAVANQTFSVLDLQTGLRQSIELLIGGLKRIGVNSDDIKEPAVDLDGDELACVCAAGFFLEGNQEREFDRRDGTDQFIELLILIRERMENYGVHFLVVSSKPFGTEFIFKRNESILRVQGSGKSNRITSKKNERAIEYAS